MLSSTSRVLYCTYCFEPGRGQLVSRPSTIICRQSSPVRRKSTRVLIYHYRIPGIQRTPD